jgi:hypothetical protein
MANTSCSEIFKVFFSKITDDMYMELEYEDTVKLVNELFISALHWFEFPRVDIYDFNNETLEYNIELSREEINIIAHYMIVEWLGQQLASVENTRMKYSGSDFKFTSQANHMQKLQSMKKDWERIGFHLQRLYKRREKDEDGNVVPTMSHLMEPYGFEERAYTRRPGG